MNRYPTIGKLNKGFSLIEIMLALLVVSIGFIAILGLLGTTLDSSGKARNDLNTVSFADMVFNYCHSVTNQDAIPVSGTLSVPSYDGSDTAISIGTLSQFTCQIPVAANTVKEVYTVSYQLNIIEDENVKTLSLNIWPGWSTKDSPRRFYTELYNWADK
ncbi:MAG: prepilin-type N-terminal cleavage/methylation domain-containing protein [Kiritimatiellaceae bacterium]|nr:prepilin-type N-terminal cleavage/methylation domain-containing protein [Kiritimatiellaceae bacterium]